MHRARYAALSAQLAASRRSSQRYAARWMPRRESDTTSAHAIVDVLSRLAYVELHAAEKAEMVTLRRSRS